VSTGASPTGVAAAPRWRTRYERSATAGVLASVERLRRAYARTDPGGRCMAWCWPGPPRRSRWSSGLRVHRESSACRTDRTACVSPRRPSHEGMRTQRNGRERKLPGSVACVEASTLRTLCAVRRGKLDGASSRDLANHRYNRHTARYSRVLVAATHADTRTWNKARAAEGHTPLARESLQRLDARRSLACSLPLFANRECRKPRKERIR
jgi:hypothetical protein